MSTTLDIKILTGRVGYEFTLDDLRLSMLCTNPVVQHIVDAFQFRAFGVAAPPSTFGPVPNALPPGLVFQTGFWVSPDDSQIVPIRFLNIELQRIVIDIAGPSSAIAGIYQRLREEVSPITAPDGFAIIGEPSRMLHFSELSVTSPMPLDSILTPGLRELLTRHLPDSERGASMILAPSLQVRSLPDDATYSGDASSSDGFTLSLSPRASIAAGQHVIYSGAPLPTEQHIEFINDLVSLFSPAKAR